MRAPLRRDLVRMSTDIEGKNAVRGQNLARDVDHMMRREAVDRRPQRSLEVLAVAGKRGAAPAVLERLLRDEGLERGIEIAGRLLRNRDGAVGVGLLDPDMQQRNVADPGLVLDLGGVVTETDNEIGAAQELPLNLPAGALDAAERQVMILIDHALG